MTKPTAKSVKSVYDVKDRITGAHRLFRATSKAQVAMHLALVASTIELASKDTLCALLPFGSPPVDLTAEPTTGTAIGGGTAADAKGQDNKQTEDKTEEKRAESNTGTSGTGLIGSAASGNEAANKGAAHAGQQRTQGRLMTDAERTHAGIGG